MKTIALLLAVLLISCEQKSEEVQRWEDTASRVEIIRDNWGIPHIYGKSDADAVFGMLYSQCEDDFNRVEMNYINAMGRLAEVEGEDEIYRDLRMKLFIDPEDMKRKYAESPDWLKKLMDAYADGINYYLYTHPDVNPKLIDRFEPWMALTFSEGSIGGDIERVSIRGLKEFYGKAEKDITATYYEGYNQLMKEPSGSNGFSIAPNRTQNGNSLFLINPHTSFFFRSEVHMVSEEGLNAYGAVTWGQFFIYQGFNDKTGWMHTSSRADAIDFYHETVSEKDGAMVYKHGDEDKELIAKTISVPYKDGDEMKEKTFTTYYSHHGPIIGERSGKWVSISLMQREMDALIQSYTRTKTTDWDSFRKMMDIRTNSSNNTVYADADGKIGYFHGNYIPKRNPKYDWNEPLDGSDPGTDHMGLHDVNDLIVILNPKSGWIQNCNSTPFTAAGEYSPKRKDYEKYMAPDRENYRGIHAVEVLDNDKYDWTLESLIEAAYDPHLTTFDELLPALQKAYRKTGDEDRSRSVHDAMKALRNWNNRYSLESIETTVAIFWGMEALRTAYDAKDRHGKNAYKYIVEDMDAEDMMKAFEVAIETLEGDFGTWKTAWGEVNRLQRINAEIRQPFNDNEPSIGIPFASGRWGSLASFGARKYGTKKLYGTSGNSFVAVVEFGEKVIAKSIVNGGQSSDINSPHFHDQAEMYAKGEFKDVYYYREDVEANMEEKYKPGQRGK